MRGTVTDPSGAVVEGATVTARQNETGLSRNTTTDHDGTYLLLELPVGHYQLQVERTGFQSYIQQGISLDVNESATVSVTLKILQHSQSPQLSTARQRHQFTNVQPDSGRSSTARRSAGPEIPILISRAT
jgi:hypothetical protein